MREGVEKEEQIAQVFISEMSEKGLSGVSLEECGFFISRSHGYLGASPDRIIYLPTQSDPGVLEMKYIQVKPGQTLKDVLVKQSVCTEKESSLILNKNHKYFYQLCHQMFSTTYKGSYFMAYGTNKEFFMQHVTYEENIWKPILLKLTGFYEEVICSLR